MTATINASTAAGGGIIQTADASGILALQTAGVTAVTVDASQNVGIGTVSPATLLEVKGSAPSINVNGTTTASFRGYSIRSNGTEIASMLSEASLGENRITAGFSGFGGFQTFYTNGVERARIDASGNLLIGTTTVNGLITTRQTANTAWSGYFETSPISGAVYGVRSQFSGYSPNNTSSYFYWAQDSTASRFFVYANGGIGNYSANNTNLSDERTKTDIENAGAYLEKICAIPVRTFKYKDQTDDLLNLGVIAQEVEAVAPELVNNEGFGEIPEDGIPLKAIYQTDLQYALMKCIQEQQALITDLTTRLAALEAK